MTAQLSKRLGNIWHALISTGFMTWTERKEMSKGSDSWNTFDDIPKSFQDKILEFEKKYEVPVK